MVIIDYRIKTQINRTSKEFKQRRIKLNYSQIKFSKESGLSQSMINKFENGKVDPSFSTILKYENTLERLENLSRKKAKDIMVKEIATIDINSNISKVMEIMIENDYSQILVEKRGIIVGVLYENSILKSISEKKDIYSESIKEYVQDLPIIVSKNIAASELSYIFQNRKTKFVLIGSIIEGIIGLVTKSDIYES